MTWNAHNNEINHRQIKKEITRKSKINTTMFPKSTNVTGKSAQKNCRIAEEFNKYFTNAGPNLANNIQNISKTFEDFLFFVQKNMEYRDLTFEEYGKAIKSVNRNKTAGHDDIDSNVKNKVYGKIGCPLFTIFHSSFNEGIFREQLKVAKYSRIFKVGDLEEVGNYRPINQVSPYSPKY